jgi:hypothetical protein
MALLVRGSTKCRICGKVIAAGDRAILFEPFLANERDPLFFFSDGAFHKACIDAYSDGAAARERAAEVHEHSRPESRICVVCGEVIRDPDDYLGFGFLTVSEVAASRFNYVHLHRSHIGRWHDLDAALEALEHLRDSGEWRGDRLAKLISELSEHGK